MLHGIVLDNNEWCYSNFQYHFYQDHFCWRNTQIRIRTELSLRFTKLYWNQLNDECVLMCCIVLTERGREFPKCRSGPLRFACSCLYWFVISNIPNLHKVKSVLKFPYFVIRTQSSAQTKRSIASIL